MGAQAGAGGRDAAGEVVFVAVGAVGKPFGVHGEVYVHPDADLAEPFAPGRSYRATKPGEAPQAGGRRLTVEWSKVHAGRQLVRFRGVEDRDAAQLLRGTVLLVPRTEVPLEGDAFWTDDLLGREVVDASGELVGSLESVLDGSAHDYLVVARPDGGEVLIPAVAALVDLSGERIVVQRIPGLLDET
jgi:16S rRNA processing protein RimM